LAGQILLGVGTPGFIIVPVDSGLAHGEVFPAFWVFSL
jgi:hypothetical protein